MPPKAKATAETTPAGDGAGTGGGRTLVIVESPAKAKTIQGYLGAGYDVEASVGHIRDLPKRAADIPAKYKGEAWARLGVDVDHGFTALYVVDADKRTKVAELKKKLRRPRTSCSSPLTRTARARRSPGTCSRCSRRRSRSSGWSSTRSPRTRSSGRQRDPRPRPGPRRRPGDPPHPRPALRLRGLAGALEEGHDRRSSAGRVQSVATRLVVDRERERIAFRSASYWDIEGLFAPGLVRAPSWSPSTAGASPPARTSTTAVARAGGPDARDLAEEAAASLAAALHGPRLHRPVGRGQALPPLARGRRS